MRIGRLQRATIVAAALLVLGASPALAEGSWQSSFTRWLPGLETRDWNDAHVDTDATTLSTKQCTASATGYAVRNLGWELNRNDTVTPDEHYGIQWVACSSSTTIGTKSWGDRGRGNFDFTLRGVNNVKDDAPGGHVSGRYIKVTY